MDKRFKVKRFLFETNSDEVIERFMLTDHLVPMNVPNRYIEMKSINKLGTGRVCAYKLCVFFNYLHEYHGAEYYNATNKFVGMFVDYLIYGDPGQLKIHNPSNSLCHSTLSGYVSEITFFYRWLDENYDSEMYFYEIERKVSTKSYLYGQIYTTKYSRIINRTLPDVKSGKEYIKWYTLEERKTLLENFLTFRDKAIFMLTLEGFRIDEVLSVRLSDYNVNDRLIQPSRSKGRISANGDINRLRIVKIRPQTVEMINKYLFTERTIAENSCGIVSDTMFLNLRGPSIGKPLSYHNYRLILKRSAVRAGIDSNKMRTHSGRSTLVMDILEHNAMHPEKAVSDVEFQQILGWTNIESRLPYENHNSEIMANSVYEKLHKDGGKDD